MAAVMAVMVVILREVTPVGVAAVLVAMLETVETAEVIPLEVLALAAVLAAVGLPAAETKHQVQAAVLVSLVKEAMAVAVNTQMMKLINKAVVALVVLMV
jgi:hypothetical protein